MTTQEQIEAAAQVEGPNAYTKIVATLRNGLTIKFAAKASDQLCHLNVFGRIEGIEAAALNLVRLLVASPPPASQVTEEDIIAIRDCADELEREINSRYYDIEDCVPSHGPYPDMHLKYNLDMEPVRRVRAILSRFTKGEK